MSNLIKPVKGVTYTPDRVGYIRAVSRQESTSDLRYSYTYEGKNKEGIKVNNIEAVKILNPWHYIGLFQFSEIALEDVGCYKSDGTRNDKLQDWGRGKNYWTGKFGATSFSVFRNSGEIQMKAIQYWINRLCNYMRNKNINEFYGKTITEAEGIAPFEVTESGVIAARHLKGDDAVIAFLKSNGKINEVDGNKTSVGKYMSLFAHYDIETCCNRKIYVKIIDLNKLGIPKIKVEIISEFKGKFNVGQIKVTHETDNEGNLPVIVRHPGTKIQLKIDGAVVETIIQKKDEKQKYEILYLGKNKFSSVLQEHKTAKPTQEEVNSNEAKSNDITNPSSTDESLTNDNSIEEVTFNIQLVEADTGKPLPDTTYYLEYKNNIKPHKTDGSGMDSGIKADICESINVWLDDDDEKKQSIYSMAFPVTNDLNGQTKVLKVPVASFNITFVNKDNKPLPNYKFMTLYRGKQSSVKTANAQGIANVKALVGQKLTIINDKEAAKVTKIVTDGAKNWLVMVDKNITAEDVKNAKNSLAKEPLVNDEDSKEDSKNKDRKEAKVQVVKPSIKETEKITEKGPTLEVKSDQARVTIKFIDESTNKPLSGLTYFTQSNKYGKNSSVTGSDGTRGRPHESLVGVVITVLVYEEGKEVKKGTIVASNDIDKPYVFKAKKPSYNYDHDIITYNIHEDFRIVKYIPKNIKTENKNKYRYTYHKSNGEKHVIFTVNWNQTKKKSSGIRRGSKPNHSQVISDANVSEGNTKRRVKYKNGDIAEYGSHPQYGNIWRLYKAGNEDVILVRIPDSLNYVNGSIKISYSFTNTHRRYTSPGHLACFLGALANTGLKITTSGSCFKEGSSFPSAEHNNGRSIDTLYLNSSNDEQRFINAMHNYGCIKQLRGSTTHKYTHTLPGGNLHNSHLHSEFDENKVIIIYE